MEAKNHYFFQRVKNCLKFKYIENAEVTDSKPEEESKALLTIALNVIGEVKLLLVDNENPFEVCKKLENEFAHKEL